MDKIKKVLNTLFGEELEIRHRLLNLILSAVVIGGFASFLITFALGFNLGGVAITGVIIIADVFCLWLSVKLFKPKLASILITVIANVIIFPIMYFFCGGCNGGMVLWLVLGLIFSWLILEGPVTYVVYVLNIVAVAVCMIVEYNFPQMVQVIEGPIKLIEDRLQSMIIVSLIIGIIFKYQAHIFEKQRTIMEEQDETLRKTLSELAKVNQAKSDFLANMSHEIRTPINAMLGMDEMILRENQDSDINEYANNIQSAGQTLLSLINDILDFSKIEAGKMEIQPVEYSLFSVINDCYNMVYMRASEKNLHFIVKNDPMLPARLYGDEVRVRQIISNLLTNAVKYTPKGTVTLRIKGRRRNDAKEMVLQVEVEDTGIGLKPEHVKELFDSFKRIDEKKNRNIEGTGLGLNITKQLLDLMDGTISVQSEYGQGSVFKVEIPQTIMSEEVMGDFGKKYEKVCAARTNYRESFRAPHARILAVDDVPMNLQVIKALLKNTGMQIETATNGRQCLEMTRLKKYNLILMDHMMPDMDGVETLHRIRAMDDYPNKSTPVIALTANAIMGVEQEYLAEGFQSYLSKPVRGAQLEDTILTYLPPELVEWESEQKPEQISEETPLERKTDCISRLDFLDTELGIEYCGGDKDFYVEILQAFVDGRRDEELERLFAGEDWKNYQIQVHTLKSTSLSIGAFDLSENAKKMEMAVKAKRISEVQAGHGNLMEQYRELLNKLIQTDIVH